MLLLKSKRLRVTSLNLQLRFGLKDGFLKLEVMMHVDALDGRTGRRIVDSTGPNSLTLIRVCGLPSHTAKSLPATARFNIIHANKGL
jgi:hypothetical protein